MSETPPFRLPTMPDVVAAGIHWTAAQAEYTAAAGTLDQDRINRAMEAYEAASATFNAAALGYALRLQPKILQERARCEKIAESVLISSRCYLESPSWSATERLAWEERMRAASDILTSIRSGIDP